MTRREDHGSNTEQDAALWEAHRSQDTYDDGRPSRAQAGRDEPMHVCRRGRACPPGCEAEG